MRKLDTLTFSGANITQSIAKGKIVVNKGKRLPWLELEMACTLANSGSTAALTLAQALAFLAAFSITIRYGTKGRLVFSNTLFTKIRILSRYMLGCGWPGVDDAAATVSGLRTSVTGSGTQAVKWYVQIPLGYCWLDDQFKDISGVGSYQASTMSIDISRGADVLPSGFTVSGGGVTAQLVMPERPCAFEIWERIPELKESNESNNIATVNGGLPYLVAETSATSTASSLTNVSVRVAGETIHDQVNAQEIATQYTSDPELTALANVSADWTVLLAYDTRDRLREMPSGGVEIQQNVKDLSSMALLHYYRPSISEQDIYDEVWDAAKNLHREVRAVNYTEAIGQADTPDSVAAFMPLALMTGSEADAKNLPSIRATENSAPAPYLPPSLKNAVYTAARNNQASGNQGAATHQVARIVARIPGGNPDPAQFKKTGTLAPSYAASAVGAMLLAR